MAGRRIFAAIVALLFVYVASPLIFPVAMGAVLATLFVPWLEWLERHRFKTPLASALMTLIITLFFVLPSSILVFIGTKEAFQQLQAIRVQQVAGAPATGTLADEGGWAGAFVSSPRVHRFLERVTEWLPLSMEELTTTAQDLSRAGAAKLADLMGELATHLPGMLIAMGVIVVSVYFFLIDGRRIVLFFRRNSVFSRAQTDEMFAALAGTCRSVILASLASGAAQALVEFVICLAVGVPNAALIGVLVLLSSFVPVIGAAPITLAVALHRFFLEQNTAAVVLFIGAGVVMLLDNLIRPLFLRGSANLHPLLAFVAAFGGLQTLGFSGVFLGPILASMFVSTVQALIAPDERT
jgi:predicted PurR-regulated permease PerM